MRRYAVSGIIGAGTDEDWYRPALADHGINWAIAIAADQATNPNKRWVLAVVAGTEAQLATVDADARCALLPFGPADLDNTWMSIGTAQVRNQLANRIQQVTGVIVQRDDQRTLREIVTTVGLTVDPNFTPETLNVADI
jgi:hypothetical protein